MIIRIAKTLVGGAVAAALLSTAASAQHVLKFGYATNEGSVYDMFAKTFVTEVEKISKGQVKSRLFCCFKMGSEQEMFKKLQLGTLDGTLIAQNNAGPFYPKIDLLVLPYVLQNAAHGIKIVDGPIGKKIWADMPEKTGVHLVKISTVSFRHVYNTKQEIKSIGDFAKMKYRVPKNVVMIDTYKAFGSPPVPLPWSETLTATQTGTVDGGDLPIDVIYHQKFHEVAKHIAMTGHFALAPPFFVSDKFMKKLNADQKAAVYKAADIGAAAARKMLAEEEAKIRTMLTEKHGVKFTEPDTKPFIAAAMKVQADFAKERGGDYPTLVKEIQDAAK